MGTYTQTYTFLNGTTADGGEVNTEIVALGNSVNNISDDNVATAGISPSKLSFVGAKAYSSATQTNITHGSYTKVQLDQTEYDTGSDFNTTLDKFVAPVTGYYHAIGSIQWKTLDPATTYLRVAIYVNASLYAWTMYNPGKDNSVDAQVNQVSAIFPASASQAIELYGRADPLDDRDTMDFVTDQNSTFLMVRLIAIS